MIKKKLAFIVFISATILGMIFAFQNFLLQSSGLMIGFYTIQGSIFIPLFLMFIIGFMAGFGFHMSRKDKPGGDNFNDYDI